MALCFAVGVPELSAFCICKPKHIESVTTAKASAVVFMVYFSFGEWISGAKPILSLEREIRNLKLLAYAVFSQWSPRLCG
jgi:hypothetical protein